ncbi:MAG: hypothetical protein A4E34_02207 [Methanoregula sp. PtaU1.Bin006]|nr:MAG: hypothetical protein A4E34_02207 [Methanoregula sp. PtaU1.Bin006]
MLTISGEDYRRLEQMIHTEIQKIFLDFIGQLEQEKTRPAVTGGSSNPGISGPGAGTAAEKTGAEVKKARKFRTTKKTREVNRLLHGTNRSGVRSSGTILEEDMEKIFRKKSRQ